MSSSRGLILSLAALGCLFFITNEAPEAARLIGVPQQVLVLVLLGAFTALLLSETSPLPAGTSRLQHELLKAAVAIGVFHVLALAIGGLFAGFGRSPYGPGPFTLLLNVAVVGLAIVVVEHARAFLINAFEVHSPAVGVILAALGFAAASLPLLGMAGASTQQEAVGLLGGDWIPLLSEHLLASFIVYLGGPLPAIAYRAILAGFVWLSPVLPDLTWGLKSLIGTIVPVFGLMVVHSMSAGQVRGAGRVSSARERSDLHSWIAAAIGVVVLIWFTLGLMPVYPTVVAGGSMSPTMEYGDLVISLKTEASGVVVGDVIDFHTDNGNVIHRVVGHAGDELEEGFITRGDANPAEDLSPVVPSQLRGKVIAVIPDAGWLTIALRSM